MRCSLLVPRPRKANRLAGVADPARAAIDRHLAAVLRSVLEERFWRPMVEGSTLEALRDDHALGRGSNGHPALFADHGIVHVRDVAVGVVDLAATVDGILLPRRPADRREFVVGLAVIIAYVHDAGMYDPTPTGRRIHALSGAPLPFSGAMDDAIARLPPDPGTALRRPDAGSRVGPTPAGAPAAPCGVACGVGLRGLIARAGAHSKSAVRGA